MPYNNYANLDFEQIKTQIKDYLRSNSNFSGFDFDGSNFSVLIDTLAYNTYVTAFNANMIVNESFLDSATLRENVVSLASNIGYTPRSKTAALSQISFDVRVPDNTTTVTLEPGLVCTGALNESSFTFSTVDSITAIVNGNIASFNNVNVYQGVYLSQIFSYDGSLDQRFILDNQNIDSSTIRVTIKKNGDSGDGIKYNLATELNDVTSLSRIYFIREVQDERYELIFGDGIFGRKLGNSTGSNQEDGDTITVRYLITDGEDGNGVSNFTFSGTLVNQNGGTITPESSVIITTNQSSINGSEIEPLSSIKYYSPYAYSSQNRAVTARDYESLIKKIYPNTESVAVIGGEELDPPEFGTINISIKPKNGSFVSDFSKQLILSKLKTYSVSGINQKIIDLKVLYVEIISSVYYNNSLVSSSSTLKTAVINNLNAYSNSIELNKFGGRFKYSKILQVIDKTDTSITSNITKVVVRRDLQATLNQFAQYELCFGNQFHVNTSGFNIKSTGFFISGVSSKVYLTDVPNSDMRTGVISIVKENTSGNTDVFTVVKSSAGIVDYIKGEIILNTVNIVSTEKRDNIIEIQAFPESNDVVGLKDLYVSFSVADSSINMVRDVIASGDDVSGVQFARDFYTSSYSNGNLKRI
tara:strand:+ start:901 stop:2826 length:1926 start_codon:yes stop_codon:yes gene_type:complete